MANGPMIFPLDDKEGRPLPQTEQARPSAPQSPAPQSQQQVSSVDFSTDTRRDLASQFRETNADTAQAHEMFQETILHGVKAIERGSEMFDAATFTALEDTSAGMQEALDAYDRLVEIQASPVLSDLKSIFNKDYSKRYQMARIERAQAHTQATAAQLSRVQAATAANRQQVLDRIDLVGKFAGAQQQQLQNLGLEATVIKQRVEGEIARFNFELDGLTEEELKRRAKTGDFKGAPPGMIEAKLQEKEKQRLAARQADATWRSTLLSNDAASLKLMQDHKQHLLDTLNPGQLQTMYDISKQNGGVYKDDYEEEGGLAFSTREIEDALVGAVETETANTERFVTLAMADTYGTMRLDETEQALQRWGSMVNPNAPPKEMQYDETGAPIPFSNIDMSMFPPAVQTAARRVQMLVSSTQNVTDPDTASAMITKAVAEVDKVYEGREAFIKTHPPEQQNAMREFMDRGFVENPQYAAETLSNTLVNPSGMVHNRYLQPLVTQLAGQFQRLDNLRFDGKNEHLKPGQIDIMALLSSTGASKPTDVERVRLAVHGLDQPPREIIMDPIEQMLYTHTLKQLAKENSAWNEFVAPTGPGGAIGGYVRDETGAVTFNPRALVEKILARPNDGEAMLAALYDSMMNGAESFATQALQANDHVTASILRVANMNPAEGVMALQERIREIEVWQHGAQQHTLQQAANKRSWQIETPMVIEWLRHGVSRDNPRSEFMPLVEYIKMRREQNATNVARQEGQ